MCKRLQKKKRGIRPSRGRGCFAERSAVECCCVVEEEKGKKTVLDWSPGGGNQKVFKGEAGGGGGSVEWTVCVWMDHHLRPAYLTSPYLILGLTPCLLALSLSVPGLPTFLLTVHLVSEIPDTYLIAHSSHILRTSRCKHQQKG